MRYVYDVNIYVNEAKGERRYTERLRFSNEADAIKVKTEVPEEVGCLVIARVVYDSYEEYLNDKGRKIRNAALSKLKAEEKEALGLV